MGFHQGKLPGWKNLDEGKDRDLLLSISVGEEISGKLTAQKPNWSRNNHESVVKPL